MPRAKLSGALLVRKEPRTAPTPAQDLDTMRDDADEKALGSPVLVWSAPLQDKAAPNTAPNAAEHPVHAVHRATPEPQATNLDPPIIEVIAGTVPPSGRSDGRASASRWTVSPAVAAVAITVLTIGSISGTLLLALNGGKASTETALSIAPRTATEKVEPALQPREIAAAVVLSQAAPEAAAANAAPAAVPPPEALPDHPSTGAPDTARVASLPDPAIPDDASLPVPKGSDATPGATLSVSTADSSNAPVEAPGSAALNSALLARGDALLVIGDFSTARMFYERAANAGHGQAALRLGETYDPAFLARTGFIGARANPAIAAHWYQRARELGVPEAKILLSAIAADAGYPSP